MDRSVDIERLVVWDTASDSARGRSSVTAHLGRMFRRKKITGSERADFCTQLATMLEARVPLCRSIEILEQQARNAQMKSVLHQVAEQMRRGDSLSRALGSQGRAFDTLFTTSVEVGQETGRLPEVMTSLAGYLRKIEALKRKLSQAMVYPALVISVAVFSVLFLLLFIVPSFAEMFRSFQMELPWSTELVLRASEAVSRYGPWIFACVVLGVYLVRSSFRSEKVGATIQSAIFGLPIVGEVLVKSIVARFCRTLGTMLRAQVSLIDAFETTRRIFTTPTVKEELDKIIDGIRRGNTVAEPITGSRIFPPMVAQMIAVGEETGELGAMLVRVAEHYEQEIDSRVETLSSVIEPVIILILGFVVAGILISMYLPMFELSNVISGM